ncbi:MAG: ferritin-like domain-containing protein [Parvibaculaceae bacterium]
MSEFASLAAGAYAVLTCADADEKARTGQRVAALWRTGALSLTVVGDEPMPVRPTRPAKPELLSHRDMPKRTFKGERGRFATLHALAHIELNAIDLAFDMAGRWASADMPRDFYEDWVKVGDEEAKHFLALQTRLAAMEGAYGDLPAHNGLWESAEETAYDLVARLAIVPMVLEARGLDVTPGMIEKLNSAGDHKSAAVLTMIYAEEQQHVAAGTRWYNYLCAERGLDAEVTFHHLVRTHFRGLLKQPFNTQARENAGLPDNFYLPLSVRP